MSSRLLEIPAEIRLEILKLLLTYALGIFVGTQRPALWNDDRHRPYPSVGYKERLFAYPDEHNAAQVLRVCRTLLLEGAPVLYGENVFDIPSLSALKQALPPASIPLIRKISFPRIILTPINHTSEIDFMVNSAYLRQLVRLQHFEIKLRALQEVDIENISVLSDNVLKIMSNDVIDGLDQPLGRPMRIARCISEMCQDPSLPRLLYWVDVRGRFDGSSKQHRREHNYGDDSIDDCRTVHRWRVAHLHVLKTPALADIPNHVLPSEVMKSGVVPEQGEGPSGATATFGVRHFLFSSPLIFR